MIEKFKLKWVYIISILFIILNSILIIKEYYWGAVIPVALLFALLFIFSLDTIILLIVFFTPLAINVQDFNLGFGVSLPTEPLMAAVLILFFLKIIFKNDYDYKLVKHPLSIAIIINLLWILICSFTSELPLVSVKFFIARLWFVIPFYFLGIILFRNPKNIDRFIWLYLISLSGVIVYTIVHHALWGFSEQAGHWVMSPFYNDHTAYGAALALFIPVTISYLFVDNIKKSVKFFVFLTITLLFIAVILSYSRAAWLSLAGALGVFVLIYFKIKFRYVFLSFAGVLIIFFTFQNQLLNKLEKNKQDSSSDFLEHIESMANISSDASNLERLNRWSAALRMFEERPFWGWGPGTYQFIYAPFQTSREKTIISTNAGDLGNAHSEYIGPLSESGILGLLSFLGIAICGLIIAFRNNKYLINNNLRYINLGVTLGLITYLLHGFLNNFLDTDKASVPFWGFWAIIVAISYYYPQKTVDTQKAINEPHKNNS